MNALFSIHLLKKCTRFWFIPMTIVTCEFNKNNIKLTPLNYFNYYTYKKDKHKFTGSMMVFECSLLDPTWVNWTILFVFCLQMFILESISIQNNNECWTRRHFTLKKLHFFSILFAFFSTYRQRIAVYNYKK